MILFALSNEDPGYTLARVAKPELDPFAFRLRGCLIFIIREFIGGHRGGQGRAASSRSESEEAVDKSNEAHLKAHQSAPSPLSILSLYLAAQLIDTRLITEIRRRERCSRLGSLRSRRE